MIYYIYTVCRDHISLPPHPGRLAEWTSRAQWLQERHFEWIEMDLVKKTSIFGLRLINMEHIISTYVYINLYTYIHVHIHIHPLLLKTL